MRKTLFFNIRTKKKQITKTAQKENRIKVIQTEYKR